MLGLLVSGRDERDGNGFRAVSAVGSVFLWLKLLGALKVNFN
jgi:hypothetical protein